MKDCSPVGFFQRLLFFELALQADGSWRSLDFWFYIVLGLSGFLGIYDRARFWFGSWL